MWRRPTAAITAGALSLAAFGATSASAATNVTYVSVPAQQLSQVVILGEANVDLIDVSVAGGTITITDQGPGGIATSTPIFCTAVDPMTITCPVDGGSNTPVRFLLVALGDGDDTLVNHNLDVESQVVPEGGADTVQTAGGSDFIDDSLGNDNHSAGAGADTLDGTSGNTDTGADVLDGGPGSDLVDYSGLPFGVQVTLGDQQANDGLAGEGDNLLGVEDVIGTDNSDSLRGSTASNQITGVGGDDVLAGLGGNDDLLGGIGDDILSGGASRDGYPDRLECGPGIDVALGQPEDLVLPDCERGGARVSGDSASVDRGRAAVKVKCPGAESVRCAVTLRLVANGRRISERVKLKVPVGSTKTVGVPLTRSGKRRLRRGGGRLLAGALADTVEPGGVATTRAQVLLFR